MTSPSQAASRKDHPENPTCSYSAGRESSDWCDAGEGEFPGCVYDLYWRTEGDSDRKKRNEQTDTSHDLPVCLASQHGLAKFLASSGVAEPADVARQNSVVLERQPSFGNNGSRLRRRHPPGLEPAHHVTSYDQPPEKRNGDHADSNRHVRTWPWKMHWPGYVSSNTTISPDPASTPTRRELVSLTCTERSNADCPFVGCAPIPGRV